MAIISFKYNFIFIKTVKTAGTSIEVDLSKVVEDEAVVTPIVPAVLGHAPRNHMLDPVGSRKFFNHMPAIAIRSLLGWAQFESMFKFCVEREPVSKTISHYHMLKNRNDHPSFAGYDKTWDEFMADGDFPVDLLRYSEVKGGRRVALVDRFLRYEQLEEELADVLSTLGIRDFRLESRAKSEYSRNRIVDYESVTDTQKQTIYRHFAESNKVHGFYHWPPRPASMTGNEAVEGALLNR